MAGPVRRLTALVALALIPLATSAAGQTFFQQGAAQPGVVITYDEIASDLEFEEQAPPSDPTVPQGANGQSSSTVGETLPCIDGFEGDNCGRPYLGMFAYDLNGDGTNIVGSVDYALIVGANVVDAGPEAAGSTTQLSSQAAVWKTDLGGFVLLDDASASFALNSYGRFSDPEATETGSAAFDITKTTNVIVGMAQGYYIEGNPSGIIDCAPGCEGALPTRAFVSWLLPILWSPSTADQWNEGVVLDMLNSGAGGEEEDDEYFAGPVGGAYAINELGTYIAGWNGELVYISGGEGYSVVEYTQAVRWKPGDGNSGWLPEGLGYLCNGEGPSCNIGQDPDNASIANDVNDAGVTVGWSGYLNNDGCGDYCGPIDGAPLASIPGGSLYPSWFSDWSPRPFVSLGPGTDMMLLSLVDPGTENSFATGEARAISNNNATAVGWIHNDFSDANGTDNPNPATGPFEGGLTWNPDSDQEMYAAAWIHPGDPNWAENELIVLGLTDERFSGEGVPDFSVANAVDQSGRLIVGKAGYVGCGECGGFEVATFWELDENFNLVRGEVLQDALADAGVPISHVSEQGEDPDAVNDLMLTEATGVRMELDENGNPLTIYVIGVGEGSFGSWIASLAAPGAPPGLTTPQSAIQSLAVAEQGARDAAEGLGFVAENQRCVRPEGTSAEEEPWCFFVVGKGMLYVDTGASGIQIGKNVGLAYFFDDDTQIGGSFGLDWLSGQVQGGSTYQALLGSVGVYAAHEPEEGIRAVGSAVYGRILKATFNRVYVNGTGTATSTGTTSGQGFGLYGELGYGFALDEKTRVVPYISASYNKSDLAGWTDTGGPFNATIAPISNSSVALSAGVKSEHDISEDLMIYAILEATAIRHQGSGVNATIAAAPFAIGAPNTWNGMVSATAGVKKEFDAHTNGYGQVTLSTNFGGYFGAAIQAGFNRTF